MHESSISCVSAWLGSCAHHLQACSCSLLHSEGNEIYASRACGQAHVYQTCLPAPPLPPHNSSLPMACQRAPPPCPAAAQPYQGYERIEINLLAEPVKEFKCAVYNPPTNQGDGPMSWSATLDILPDSVMAGSTPGVITVNAPPPKAESPKPEPTGTPLPLVNESPKPRCVLLRAVGGLGMVWVCEGSLEFWLSGAGVGYAPPGVG